MSGMCVFGTESNIPKAAIDVNRKGRCLGAPGSDGGPHLPQLANVGFEQKCLGAPRSPVSGPPTRLGSLG